MIESWDDHIDYDYNGADDYYDAPYVDTDTWYYGRWVRTYTGKLGRITDIDDNGIAMYPITAQLLNADDTETFSPDELTKISETDITEEEKLAWSLMIMKD